jgi:hypothetical protein
MHSSIGRLEQLVRDQMAKIDQLRSEVDGLVDWINGDNCKPSTTTPQRPRTTGSKLRLRHSRFLQIGFYNRIFYGSSFARTTVTTIMTVVDSA